MASRGQSEVLSSILVVVIIVLTVGIFGVHAVGQMGQNQGPTVEVGATTPPGEITLTHLSGDVVSTSDLIVILRYNGNEDRYNISSEGTLTGDGDQHFEPGETWNKSGLSHDSGDRVTVYLVHEPSGTLLFEETRYVSTSTPTPTPAPTS